MTYEYPIPVRCFTCNKVLGHLWKRYSDQKKAGIPEEIILNNLGLKRYCCRRMLITHIDLD